MSRASFVLFATLVTACAARPTAPAASPTEAVGVPGVPSLPAEERERVPTATVVSTTEGGAPSSAIAAPALPVFVAETVRPRLRPARAHTTEIAVRLVSRNPEDEQGGESLRIAVCPHGNPRPTVERVLALPFRAAAPALARGGGRIFAGAYIAGGADDEPASSRLFALDEKLRVLASTSIGEPRRGDFVPSLSVGADDRYVVSYENDPTVEDTAIVRLLDAKDLRLIAQTRVGGSHTTESGVRQRLVLTENDLYVLAPVFPPRHVPANNGRGRFLAEEYVLTRFALPNLAAIAQAPTGRHELGDLPLTLQHGLLRIEDFERVDTFSLDLKTHRSRTIPPRNAPPPPTKRACGE